MDTLLPGPLPKRAFEAPQEAWAYIAEIYYRNTGFIRDHLVGLSKGIVPKGRVRAFMGAGPAGSRDWRRGACMAPPTRKR